VSGREPIEARPQKRPPFPFKVYFYACGIYSVLMLICWFKGQYGDDLAAWLSVILFGAAFHNILRGFFAYDFYRDEVALNELVLKPSYTDGTARFLAHGIQAASHLCPEVGEGRHG
jgi:hypothetical protein